MSIVQKRKILTRMSELEHDIAELKRVRLEVAESGFASATVSSGGGSKSYSRIDIGKLTELISAMSAELAKLRALVAGSAQTLWKTVRTVYG